VNTQKIYNILKKKRKEKKEIKSADQKVKLYKFIVLPRVSIHEYQPYQPNIPEHSTFVGKSLSLLIIIFLNK
jgi:hypothetical protein